MLRDPLLENSEMLTVHSLISDLNSLNSILTYHVSYTCRSEMLMLVGEGCLHRQ